MLTGKTIVVAGGTGNIGSLLVQELLRQGATVVVPTRSRESLSALHDFLASRSSVERLRGFVGDSADPDTQMDLLKRITAEIGPLDAAIASLGRFQSASSLLHTKRAQFQAVLDDYLLAHFCVAKLFLNEIVKRCGTYIFINGPLAFSPWKGTALVSMATAAQHMLFQSLAKELTESPVNVVELVNYAFVRERATQPSSALPGEATGAYAAWLIARGAHDLRGRSIHLDTMEVLEQAGVSPP